jgi:glycosyltransferase involved in cell wall biosynthesis
LILAPRILIVAPKLDVGGAEIHLLRVVPPLRHAGLDVQVFTIARGGQLESQFAERDVPVYGIEATGWRLQRSVKAALALRREIDRLRPDILHFFLPEPALVGALASIGRGRAVKLMSRRSLTHYRRNHVFFGWLDRRLTRFMTGVLGNSTAVAEELIQDCGSPQKVGIVHNGVELPAPVAAAARALTRAQLGVPEDAMLMIVIANLIPYKGHADLIAALGMARERLGEGWRVLLVGRDDGFGAVLRSQAEALGIAGNLLWLGECSNMGDLLAAADIGVLASHQEGFSNSLIEMMAQGLPVIATRIGGNIDAIADGESGKLVPVQNAAALGAAILELMSDAAARKRIGEAARSRVTLLFSLDACLGRYIDLYKGLIADRSAPVAKLLPWPEVARGPATELATRTHDVMKEPV